MFGQECPLLCCGTGCCFFAVNAAGGVLFRLLLVLGGALLLFRNVRLKYH